MNNEMIRFAFTWIPSFIFIFAVLSGFLVGMIRGFRKSTILLIQAITAFVICLIVYFCIVNSSKLDSNMLKLTNSILSSAGQGTLQDILGVSSSCESITDVLIEYIPKQMDFGDGFKLVIYENGAYLKTIVDLVYHMLVALILVLVYFVLIFIFYIVYLIFYSEGKYKRKKNQRYRNAECEHGYKKHALLGGLVGGLRKGAVSIVSLAFIASLFFILGGGIGDNSYDSYSTFSIEEDNIYQNQELDSFYEIYKNFRSYGDSGIYKVLNIVKTKDDVPFYLFAVDLVFQGGLTDERMGIDENIYFRREIGEYTNFATNTLDLLLKHGGSEISDFINGHDTENRDMLEVVVKVMSKEDFQSDFDSLIDNFNDNTYFINFALSLINSIGANLDKDITFLSSLDPTTRDILKILFVGENKIKVTDLVSKEDTKMLMGLVFKAMSYDSANKKDDADGMATALNYGKVIVPEISKLSIFNDKDKTKKLNGTLKELYDYFYNKIQTEVEEISYEEASDRTNRALLAATSNTDDIDWIEEIKSILDAGVDIITLYEGLTIVEGDMFKSVLSMFDSENENSVENEKAYDNVTEVVSDSRLLGVLLSAYLNETINTMATSISSDIKMPSTYTYANEYNSDGTVFKHGELYNILTVLKTIAKNEEARGIFLEENEEDKSSDIEKYVDLFNVKTSDDTTILDTALESEIFEYLISGMLLNMEIGQYRLYIPEETIGVGREEINLIHRKNLKALLEGIPEVIDVLSTDDGEVDVDALVSDEEFKQSLRESVILEGTFANVIKDTLNESPNTMIPKRLEETKAWLSTSYADGEVIVLLDALNEADISIKNLDASSLTITNEKLTAMLESDVLYYTLSKNIDDKLKNITEAPDEAYQTIDEQTVIKKDEISKLMNGVIVLNDAEDTGIQVSQMEFNELTITKAKVNALVESMIAHRILTDKVEEALNNDIPTQAYETGLRDDINPSEINIVIDTIGSDVDGNKTIKIGGADATDFSVDSITTSQIEVMKTSVIIRYLVTNQLSKNDTIVMTKDLEYTENDYVDPNATDKVLRKYISELELQSSLEATILLFGEDTNSDSINDKVVISAVDAQTATISSSQLDSILESEIYHLTFDDQIKNNLGADMPNDGIYEAVGGIDDVTTSLEIKKLIHSTEVLFGVSSITITSLDFSEFNIKASDIDEIIDSRIIHKKMSVELGNALSDDDPNTYDVPTTAYEGASLEYITKEEISNLVYSASVGSENSIKIGGGDETDLSFTSIKEEKFTYMTESIIVRYKVTNTLKNENQVVLPNYEGFMDLDSNNSEYICEAEFSDFLNSFYSGYGVDGAIQTNNINIVLPSEDKFDDVLSSTIIRATITSKIKININSEAKDALVEVSDLDINSTHDQSQKVVIIGKDELYNALTAIRVISSGDSFEFELSIGIIAALSTENIYKIAKSNMIRLMLNNIIRDSVLKYENLTKTSEPTLTIYNGTKNVVVDNSIALEETAGVYSIKSSLATLSNAIAVFNVNQKETQNLNIYCNTIDNTTTNAFTLQVYFAMYAI